MNSNFWLLLFGLLLVNIALWNGVQCNSAREECRSMYRLEANEMGTTFLNNNCQVQCNFTGGRMITRDINEGKSCPPGLNNPNYVCRSGKCVNNPNNNPNDHHETGRLTILSTDAELATSDLDTYLLVCVINNSIEPINPLPLREWDWQHRCHSCSSDVVKNDKRPHWVAPCPMSERYPISRNSRIIFEIWTLNNISNKSDRFLGGVHVRLDDLIQRRKLGQKLILALANGPVSGRLSTTIEWD